jgi:hypothetical protein
VARALQKEKREAPGLTSLRWKPDRLARLEARARCASLGGPA